MVEILQSKKIINDEINTIFSLYEKSLIEKEESFQALEKKMKIISDSNQLLIHEISEKDKLLFMNEKKMNDYEEMINKIQDEANKEIDERTKHDMLRAQDKEIYQRDLEIKSLKKKIETLENQGNNIEEEIKEIENDQWKEYPHNSLWNDKEKVKIAIEAYINFHEKVNDATLQDIAKSSLGVNGWFEEGTKKVETNVEEVVEEETQVINEDSSSEEETVVTIIKHYGKEYYIIEGEEPQYIYAINNGELGDKKGEMKNGKKMMYKK